MRRWVLLGIGVSLLAHGGLALGVSRLPTALTRHVTAVAVMQQQKPKAKAAEPDPPKPVEIPPETQRALRMPRKAAAPPEPAATPPEAAPSPASAAFGSPDFGLQLGNGAGGGGGIAVPRGEPGARPKASAEQHEKVLRAPTNTSKGSSSDECDEPIVKPVMQNRVQAAYPDEARSAEIEGRVVVKVTVDSNGAVKGVDLVKGLGHGLDQAAATAARQMAFAPATRCGKAVEGTYVHAFAFRLGE